MEGLKDCGKIIESDSFQDNDNDIYECAEGKESSDNTYGAIQRHKMDQEVNSRRSTSTSRCSS